MFLSRKQYLCDGEGVSHMFFIFGTKKITKKKTVKKKTKKNT